VDVGFLAFWDSRLAGFMIPLTARFAVKERAMSQPHDDRQDDLFRSSLEAIINLRHPLVRLAAEIN
jgi:IS5 family transposase